MGGRAGGGATAGRAAEETAGGTLWVLFVSVDAEGHQPKPGESRKRSPQLSQKTAASESGKLHRGQVVTRRFPQYLQKLAPSRLGRLQLGQFMMLSLRSRVNPEPNDYSDTQTSCGVEVYREPREIQGVRYW